MVTFTGHSSQVMGSRWELSCAPHSVWNLQKDKEGEASRDSAFPSFIILSDILKSRGTGWAEESDGNDKMKISREKLILMFPIK